MFWDLKSILSKLDEYGETFEELMSKWMYEYTYPPIYKIFLIEVEKNEIRKYKSPAMTFAGLIGALREQAKKIEKIKKEELQEEALEVFYKNLSYINGILNTLKEAVEIIEQSNEAQNKLSFIRKFISDDIGNFLYSRLGLLVARISKKVAENEDARNDIKEARLLISTIDRLYKSVTPLNTLGITYTESAPIKFSIDEDIPVNTEDTDITVIMPKVEQLLSKVDSVLQGKEYLEILYRSVEEALSAGLKEVDASEVPPNYVRSFIDIYKKATLKYNPTTKKIIIAS